MPRAGGYLPTASSEESRGGWVSVVVRVSIIAVLVVEFSRPWVLSLRSFGLCNPGQSYRGLQDRRVKECTGKLYIIIISVGSETTLGLSNGSSLVCCDIVKNLPGGHGRHERLRMQPRAPTRGRPLHHLVRVNDIRPHVHGGHLRHRV